MQLRHDHKNFCIGLMSELTSGNINAAISLLDKEYDISNSEYLMQGNIINSIINIKQVKASQKSIEIIPDCTDISKIKIAPTDLAIILGNALDNAIEACSELKTDVKRIIEVFITLKNNKVYISIKNPVHKNIDTDNLLTSKTIDAEQHGFGIISIKQIADKYHGEAFLSCENNIFTIMVIMQNLEQNY